MDLPGLGAGLTVRDPLARFLALGALLALIHAALGGTVLVLPHDDRVVVDALLVQALAAQQHQQLGRDPTDEELDAAIDEHVRDVVLYQEARARGLDAGDRVVRRRLVQKLRFLLEAEQDPGEPDHATLEAWRDARAERWGEAETFRFEVVLFDPERRTDADADARAWLADPDPDHAGDPRIGGRTVGPWTADRVSRELGEALPEALRGASEDAWIGPFDSREGVLVLRLEEHLPARMPPVEVLGERLIEEWRHAERVRLRDEAVDRLVAAREVVIAGRSP